MHLNLERKNCVFRLKQTSQQKTLLEVTIRFSWLLKIEFYRTTKIYKTTNRSNPYPTAHPIKISLFFLAGAAATINYKLMRTNVNPCLLFNPHHMQY